MCISPFLSFYVFLPSLHQLIVALICLPTKGKTQLPLNGFLTCLRAAGEDVDADELECLMANLIANGLVKGYVSHEHRMLVVRKENPFPSVASVIASK